MSPNLLTRLRGSGVLRGTRDTRAFTAGTYSLGPGIKEKAFFTCTNGERGKQKIPSQAVCGRSGIVLNCWEAQAHLRHHGMTHGSGVHHCTLLVLRSSVLFHAHVYNRANANSITHMIYLGLKSCPSPLTSLNRPYIPPVQLVQDRVPLAGGPPRGWSAPVGVAQDCVEAGRL